MITIRRNDFETWVTQAFEERGGSTALTLSRDLSLAEEAYRLGWDGKEAVVAASTEQGTIWALSTLLERLEAGVTAPFHVEEKPRYPYRGLHLDCARHFFPAGEVKRVIDEMSRVKLNKFHWHLADDQGFRIESKHYPKLHTQCGDQWYSQDEIREIVEYARVRGVEVIPELDMPGHTSSILSAYPQYSCSGKQVEMARCGGIYPIVLCPGQESVYAFLEDLLDELCGLFPGKWFHIGGDEAPDGEWKSCPHCQAKLKDLMSDETRTLQGYFSGRVKDILKKQEKNVLCWNDSLEAPNFSWQGQGQETTVQFWSVQFADSMVPYIQAGGNFIYSDMFQLYLDYPCGMTSAEKVYRTDPVLRGVDLADGPGLMGMECCLWTEHIRDCETLERRLFPRVYAFAENVWYGNDDYTAYEKKLIRQIETAKRRGICCLSLEEANPSGEARKQEIIEYTGLLKTAMPEEVREVTLAYTKPNKEFNDRFMYQFLGIGEPC